MKIMDIRVSGSGNHLVCTMTWEDGSQSEAAAIWRSQAGMWPSDSDAREPAEVAAHLRGFARAIEEFAKAKAA